MPNVLNRYVEKVEIQFDAAFNPESPYVWAPGEVKALSHDAAMFCRRKSVVKEDPITGKQVRALLVQGIDAEYDAYVTGTAPPLPYRGVELLDRTHLAGAASAERITHLPIANPQIIALERESITPTTHARKVT